MSTLAEQYDEFAEELKHRRRYFLSESSQKFLSGLKELAKERNILLEQGEVLYRARRNELVKGSKEHQPSLLPRPPDQMKPAINMNSEGRANSYNITMMYLASSEETAIAEVRPDVSFPVTVSNFKVVKEIKLVDFVSLRPNFYWWFGFAGDDENLWMNLSNDYSRPLYKEEQRINYLPTQVIAEFFMAQGYDGLVYQSQFKSRKLSSDNGEDIAKNFVIFDIDAVEHVKSEVWKICEQTVLVEKCGK
jgi:hypothetical protein